MQRDVSMLSWEGTQIQGAGAITEKLVVRGEDFLRSPGVELTRSRGSVAAFYEGAAQGDDVRRSTVVSLGRKSYRQRYRDPLGESEVWYPGRQARQPDPPHRRSMTAQTRCSSARSSS